MESIADLGNQSSMGGEWFGALRIVSAGLLQWISAIGTVQVRAMVFERNLQQATRAASVHIMASSIPSSKRFRS
jgi:hypothetical protein